MKGISYKTSLRTTLSLMLLVLALAVVLQSCYPGDAITASDTDIVATFFDKETNFSSLLTFAMPDSVIHIDDGSVTNDNVSRAYDQQVISKIKQNLTTMGFTESADPASADVHVVTLATSTTWVSGGCYGGYWSYWYPYYGWCYPVAYTYSTGTILIVMAQPDKQGDNKGVWIAGLNGILEDTSTGIANRINQGIDQAFIQSPYLGEGK